MLCSLVCNVVVVMKLEELARLETNPKNYSWKFRSGTR